MNNVKCFIFPIGKLLSSYWECLCLPIGNALVFLLGTHSSSYWEHTRLPIGNTIAFLLGYALQRYRAFNIQQKDVCCLLHFEMGNMSNVGMRLLASSILHRHNYYLQIDRTGCLTSIVLLLWKYPQRL